MYSNNITISSPKQLLGSFRYWLEDRDGFKDHFMIYFYQGKWSKELSSISMLPAGETLQFISTKEAEIADLGEPVHMNWYQHGICWIALFNHVVGVIHTIYLESIKREVDLKPTLKSLAMNFSSIYGLTVLQSKSRLYGILVRCYILREKNALKVREIPLVAKLIRGERAVEAATSILYSLSILMDYNLISQAPTSINELSSFLRSIMLFVLGIDSKDGLKSLIMVHTLARSWLLIWRIWGHHKDPNNLLRVVSMLTIL
ncbi:Digalactosyldiacylglycerol synthase 2 chloroplastic [Euphorbia peplus]|nr:Digalactosyldiacylglycerol synthase 2 chloroplastic [Euphorbia peplus]